MEYRHLYKVNNHCEYFFDNIDAIIDPDQVPFEFYVRTRRRFGWFQKVKKQNIKHSLWMMNNLFVDADIEIIDINSSWYNWLHPQKHVEIIFVIPIGDYDLMGVNDRSISRLRESRRKLRQLSEWNAVLKGRLHRNPLMVLTKYDVFKQKIKTKSIANVFMPSDTFPFDKDPHNEQDGKQFVMDCFVKEFQIYNSSAYVQLNGPLNFIRVNSLDSQQAFNVINHRMREIVLQESEIEIKCVNL